MVRLLRRRALVVLCCAASVSLVRAAEAPGPGYHSSVPVAAETRLDWVFAVANQSPKQPPKGWLEGYDSAKQTYELFVPPGVGVKGAKDAKKPQPLVLFISAGDKAAGAASWQQACRELGIILAGPHGAGNDCPMQRRVRIVMDVLDDVGRKYHIDPDRTYIAGFSGGGRVACGIAFGLPEYFGGVIPICAGGELREEPWLRQRVIDRLSIAHLTGDDDFNRGEIERWRHAMLAEVGVRSRVWVVPKLGHGVPGAKPFAEAFRWLEAGLASRRALAKKHPASSIGTGTGKASGTSAGASGTAGATGSASAPLSRDAWAVALLAEGKGRLKQPGTLYSGLMQLHGLHARWPDLPAALEARKILEEYDARTERPWEADDIAEQRRFLIARARSLDGYASGPLPAQYAAQRREMLSAAVELWKQVEADGQDRKAAAQAKERIPALQRLLKEEKAKP